MPPINRFWIFQNDWLRRTSAACARLLVRYMDMTQKAKPIPWKTRDKFGFTVEVFTILSMRYVKKYAAGCFSTEIWRAYLKIIVLHLCAPTAAIPLVEGAWLTILQPKVYSDLHSSIYLLLFWYARVRHRFHLLSIKSRRFYLFWQISQGIIKTPDLISLKSGAP